MPTTTASGHAESVSPLSAVAVSGMPVTLKDLPRVVYTLSRKASGTRARRKTFTPAEPTLDTATVTILSPEASLPLPSDDDDWGAF